MSSDPEPGLGADEATEGTMGARRAEAMRRLVAGFAVAGALLAVAVGLLGGTGRTGLAVLLLLASLGCAVAALYGVGTALWDETRDVAGTGRRIVVSIGLFFAAAALMAMVAGVGG